MNPSDEQRPARALVLWANDRSANLGVRVLAEGSEALLRSALGNDVQISFQDFGANADGFKPTLALIKRDLVTRERPIRSWLRDFDLVLDTGAGDSFADIYGWERVFRMIYVQVAAARLRIPVVLGPQTIGPFTSRRMRLAARYALRRASLVVARDSVSLRYARQLGARRPMGATDVVFSLPRPPRTPQHDVIVNISGLLWNSDAHGDRQRYRAEIAALLDGLAERDRRVSLLAHVLSNATEDDDVPVVLEVAAQRGLLAIVPTDTTEVREVLASARLVIGSRMHACLNAISTGTPAIPWAYSRKFSPLLGDLGWSHVVDLATSASPSAETLAMIDRGSDDFWSTQVRQVLDGAEQRLAPVVAVVKRLGRSRSRRSGAGRP